MQLKMSEQQESEHGRDGAPASDPVELFHVVVNDEEQYSIWPADGIIPAGWHVLGKSDSREACLAYIDAHWTDMRPKSLRMSMARSA